MCTCIYICVCMCMVFTHTHTHIYIYIYIYIVMYSILVTYYIAATSRHTGRGVVGDCWQETPGVENMGPIFAKPVWIEGRAGLLEMDNWTKTYSMNSWTETHGVNSWTEACSVNSWKEICGCAVRKKRHDHMQENGQLSRSLIEHNFLSCLYRGFMLTIAPQISPIHISLELYYVFLLFC